jgi:hypothetical protein
MSTPTRDWAQEEAESDERLYRALRAYQEGCLEPVQASTCVGRLDQSLTALYDHLRPLLRAAESRGREAGLKQAAGMLCWGCREGWPLTEDGTRHQQRPGARGPWRCYAAPLRSLLPTAQEE